MSALTSTARIADRDGGFSVTELMVTVTLGIVLAAVVGSFFVDAFGVFGKSHRMSNAATQAHKSFLLLDKQVRGAAAINRPVHVGTDQYVEFVTTASGANVCTQWRFRAGADQLQVRAWTSSNGVATGLTAWQTLADKLVNDPAVAAQVPFRFRAADATVTRQSIDLHLLSHDGAGTGAGRAGTRARFVARNSSVATATNVDGNGDGRSDSEVCQEVGRS